MAGADATHGTHLVHLFLQKFEKQQLLCLQKLLFKPVDFTGFEQAVYEAVPKFALSLGEVKSYSDSQRNTLLELFKQIDRDCDEHISWDDIGSLVIDLSTTNSLKQMRLYSDVPSDITFSNTTTAVKDVIQSSVSVEDETSDVSQNTSSTTITTIGKKIQGVGLYWEDIECLKYFQHLRIFCLVGASDIYLFTINDDNKKATIVTKLIGPTAAVFSIYHFQPMQKIVACCADRYLYAWNDNLDRSTSTEKLKVNAPQLCASVDEINKLLFTGGTDGAILIFAYQGKITLLHRVQCSKEWLCDLLLVQELGQLITCQANGKVIVWDVGWEDEQHEILTFRVRSVKNAHESSVKTQITYSQKYRIIFSIGYGRNILCWNPFISSQTHVLRGHDKLLCKIHAFDSTPEVISADIMGKIIIWDMRTLTPIQTLGGSERKRFRSFSCNKRSGPPSPQGSMTHILYSDTQRSIVTINLNGIFIWHLATGELQGSYSHFSSSEKTAAVLINNNRDLMLGDIDGSIQVMSLLNGSWGRRVSCSDSVVGILTMLSNSKIDQCSNSESQLLVIATLSGVISIRKYSKIYDFVELLSWKSLLDSVSWIRCSTSGQFLCVASKRSCELWQVDDQTLKKSITCTFPITQCLFIQQTQSFILAEGNGVLHFYSFPGFCYLTRFVFESPCDVFYLNYLHNTRQLLCSAEGVQTTISLTTLIALFDDKENRLLWQNRHPSVNGRYSKQDTVWNCRVFTAYDHSTKSRFSLTTTTNNISWLVEKEILSGITHSDEIVSVIDSFQGCLSQEQDYENTASCSYVKCPFTKRTSSHARTLSVRKPTYQGDATHSFTGNKNRLSMRHSFQVSESSSPTEKRSRRTKCRSLAPMFKKQPSADKCSQLSESQMFLNDSISLNQDRVPVYYNLLEPFDTDLLTYARERSSPSQEIQHILLNILNGLEHLGRYGIAILLSPNKIARIKGTWKIIDVSHAHIVQQTDKLNDNFPELHKRSQDGIAIILKDILWKDCPPELALVKCGKQAISELSMLVDVWGIGLIMWSFFKKEHLFSQFDEGQGNRYSKTLQNFDLHTSSVKKRIPSDLQTNPIMRPLLEGVLTKSTKRWSIQKIKNHLNQSNCKIDTQLCHTKPFPVARSLLNEKQPIIELFEHSVISTTDNIPPSSIIINRYYPKVRDFFTCSKVVDELDCIFTCEGGVYSAISCFTPEGDYLGSLPSQQNIDQSELSKTTNCGTDKWCVPEYIKKYCSADPQITKEQSLVSPRSKHLYRKDQRVENYEDISPFFTACRFCGETVTPVVPFYIRGTSRKGPDSSGTSIAKQSRKVSPLDVPLQQDKPLGRKLGLEFLLATPRQTRLGETTNVLLDKAAKKLTTKALAKQIADPSAFVDSSLFVSSMSSKSRRELRVANQLVEQSNLSSLKTEKVNRIQPSSQTLFDSYASKSRTPDHILDHSKPLSILIRERKATMLADSKRHRHGPP